MSLQAARRREAFGNVGRRCAWVDADGIPEGYGTIRNVGFRGGWPWYSVEWDEEAPGWWASSVSTAPSDRFVILA